MDDDNSKVRGQSHRRRSPTVSGILSGQIYLLEGNESMTKFRRDCNLFRRMNFPNEFMGP